MTRSRTTTSAKSPSGYDAVSLGLFGFATLSPPTRSLLRAMAMFDPTDIRERYLASICRLYVDSRKTAQWQNEVFLLDFPVEEDACQHAIDELLGEGYIQPHDNGLGYFLEYEVRALQLDQLSNDRRTFDAAFRTAVWALFDLWPFMTDGNEPDYAKYAEYNLWGRRDELVIHVAGLERLFTGAEKKLKEDCCGQRYIRLLTEAAW